MISKIADTVAPVLCLIQCHRCKSALTCAAWQWNYVARPRDNYVALSGCKLIPSDSWHSATLMMHTINLGRLTNKLNKLRDKSNLQHFYLIEICSLETWSSIECRESLGCDNVGKDSGNVNFVPHYNFISVRMGPVLSLQQR